MFSFINKMVHPEWMHLFIFSSKFQVPSSKFQVPSSKFQVPSSKFLSIVPLVSLVFSLSPSSDKSS